MNNLVPLVLAFSCAISERADSVLGKLSFDEHLVKDLISKNTKLTEKVANLESDLRSLKEILQSQEKAKKNLELSILNLRQNFDDLYKRLQLESKYVGSDAAQVESESEGKRKEEMSLVADGYKPVTTHKTSEKDRVKRQEDEHVAFSAYVNHEVLAMGKDQTVQFQNVIINDGKGYNKFTGVFTVPRDGVYQLTFFVEDYHRFQSIFHMVVNRNIVTSAIADPIPVGQNVQGGNTVIIRLNAGDSVWVSCGSAGNNIEGYGRLRTSTFSGYFLYA
ncbi:uncharacterized protein LOC123544133 [Mercenaria mercenaria]|uniref:uncharacterized protein LOC123544133 n=1 Tax=Mercenaria mercenaria TaxID=6596 RepID=UPI00234E7E96|nr:uncharacterized protein LOC123544133 [Mercenaria mercenaria]